MCLMSLIAYLFIYFHISVRWKNSDEEMYFLKTIHIEKYTFHSSKYCLFQVFYKFISANLSTDVTNIKFTQNAICTLVNF